MKITDKKELTKLVSYMVMGDGGLYINHDCKNAKFIMNMVAKNEDYVRYCQSVLSNLTSTKVYYSTKEGNRQDQLRLETKTLPFFTKLHERIYTYKYKGIDPHILKLLDWESLAILYMSDGSMVKDTRTISPDSGIQVTLNMKRLSYGDLFILKKALKDKLNLEWNINRQNQYYYLRLRSKDVDIFMEHVSKHVTNSFQYKIKSNFRVVNSTDKVDGEIVRSA